MSKSVNWASTGVGDRPGLAFWLQSLIFVVAYCLIISRRPDALFNPQFFVEDGAIWYSQAYNLGWLQSLAVPYSGYFVTLPRLVAGLALLVPLRFAPLLMNIVGIAFQTLPVNFLLSDRCSMWGSLPERIFYAAVYLGLPNPWGIDATVTNAQWHLALISCLLILARPSRELGWRVFDFVIVLLSAVTGPFCLVLLPLALIFRWKREDSPSRSVLVALAFGVLLQTRTMYETASAVRHPGLLGASIESFVRILGGQVYLGALLGHNNLASRADIVFLGCVVLLGILVLLYCFAFAGLELKVYLAFCVLLFAAALRSPLVAAEPSKWDTLKSSSDSQYWFFPMLGFAWSLMWCFRHGRSQWVRILSAAMLFLMCIGVAKDWRYTAYPDLNFREYVRNFDAAPAGTIVSIPVNPVGGSIDWTMRLKKR